MSAFSDDLFLRLSHSARLTYPLPCLYDGGASGRIPAFGGWAAKTQRREKLAASAGIALFIVALQVPRTWIWLDFVRREGVGYSSRVWGQSALLNRLRQVDPAAKLFSNAPDVIYTLLGRSSGSIPSKVQPDTRASNPEFDVQLAKMEETIRVNKGFLIIFDRVNWRWYLPTAHELESRIPLIAIVRTDDGVIYRSREN